MTGEGACTPIADTKKGKDSENLKKVLVFQLLLAVIANPQSLIKITLKKILSDINKDKSTWLGAKLNQELYFNQR